MSLPPTVLNQIEDRLRRLPPEKLGVVLDFVGYLADRPNGFDTSAAREALSALRLLPGQDQGRAGRHGRHSER